MRDVNPIFQDLEASTRTSWTDRGAIGQDPAFAPPPPLEPSSIKFVNLYESSSAGNTSRESSEAVIPLPRQAKTGEAFIQSYETSGNQESAPSQRAGLPQQVSGPPGARRTEDECRGAAEAVGI